MKNKLLAFLDIRKGRLHRLNYLALYLFSHFLLMCSGVLSLYLLSLFENQPRIGAILSLPFIFAVLYFMAVITARRLRDMNINGYFAVLLIGLQISLWSYDARNLFDHVFVSSFLLLVFLPPQRQDNKYGPYVPYGIFKLHKDRTYVKEETSNTYRPSGRFLIIGGLFTLIVYYFSANFLVSETILSDDEPMTLIDRITGIIMFVATIGIITLTMVKDGITVRVTSKGIRAYNQFITDCLWEEIVTVKVKRKLFYLGGKVMHLKNMKGRTILQIPYKGLTDYDDFVQTCIEKAPKGNALALFLRDDN